VPERPDLDYVVPILDRELRGRSIVGMRVRKPVVLRAPSEIRGTIRGVTRLAHVVQFDLGDHVLAVSPMLAGRFQIDGRETADLAVAWTLDDGRELRYRDDVQMGKVYLLPPGGRPPGLEAVGVDVLSPVFTRERFRALAKARRDQVKVFLMDKSALDAMGNAYADEVLWEARLHPKRMVRELGPAEVDQLHDAIVAVIGHACRVIGERAPPIDQKVRDFLHVRGRKDQPCDRCGTTLRVTGVHGHDAYFCPTCQPDVKGRGFVDWRRLRP
jgi:formamidopyrimidine-DNA glycosylase